jgi:hypothetical protein
MPGHAPRVSCIAASAMVWAIATRAGYDGVLHNIPDEAVSASNL